MKESLTVINVKTIEELVDRYESKSNFTVAFVEELNGYAIAVAYESKHRSKQGESVTKTDKSLENIISRIGKENRFAMSNAYASSHTEYSGISAAKKGGTLKSIISRSNGSNRVDYHIYLVHKKQIELYWLAGDILDSFGYCYTLNLTDKTINKMSLTDKKLVSANDYVKSKVIVCTL